MRGSFVSLCLLEGRLESSPSQLGETRWTHPRWAGLSALRCSTPTKKQLVSHFPRSLSIHGAHLFLGIGAKVELIDPAQGDRVR